MELIVALLIDLLLGDPVYPFHPIRLMGNAISTIDKTVSKIAINGYLQGALLWVLAVGFSLSVFVLLPQQVWQLHSVAGSVLSIYLFYSCIAFTDLLGHAKRVIEATKSGPITEAREKLSWIVGRETKELSQTEIYKAVIETLAENFSDGVIAPLFYALLFGLPGIIVYKVINTLDSMVGYKQGRFKKLGYVSAKIDDVANYIPARLTMLFLMIPVLFDREKRQTIFIDRKKHSSPNAGCPEAAMAVVLNIKMGGAARYHGEVVSKPYINEMGGDATEKEAMRSMQLLRIVYFLLLFCIILKYVIVTYIS